METTTLFTNPSFAVLKQQEGEILFSLYGEIKMLRGAVPVISTILDSMEEGLPKEALQQRATKEHPETTVAKMLDNMLGSGIFMEKKSGDDKQPPKTIAQHASPGVSNHQLGCLGVGDLAKTLSSMTNTSNMISIAELDSPATGKGYTASEKLDTLAKRFEENLQSLQLSAMAVCPENMNYLELCALNRACLALGLPWILGHFNGKQLMVGPTVIPYKTPCLECLLEHRLKALNPALGIGWQDFLHSTENYPLPDDPCWQTAAHWAAWLMSAELQALASGKSTPQYMKRQIQISREATPELADIQFEAITTCPACQGMNRGYMKKTPSKSPDDPGKVEIHLTQETVRHGDNGLRALSAEDARMMLDRAFGLLKTNVRIHQSRGGLLDEIIPSFRSYTSSVYDPNLPFIISEHRHWGKGMNAKQAYLSAGFEMMERICAEYSAKIEMLQCPYKEVQEIALDLETRVGKQYYLRNMDKLDANIPVDWVWGWSLTNKKNIMVPASMVFLSRSVFQGKFILGSSSGLSAGTTMEDAILQGLLEAVEHDARYIWQANFITPPKLTDLPPKAQEIKEQLKAIGCDLIVRDYTTDLGVYIFRAWIVQPDNPVLYASSGMGASLRPEIALYRAISEAKQSWPSETTSSSTDFASKNNTDLFGYNTATLFMHYQDNVTELLAGGPEKSYSDCPDRSSGNISQDIRVIVKSIGKNSPGSDVVAVNLTREEFGIPAVRVITSGLQNPSQPLQNFPQDRLFDLPVKLGFRSKRLSFKELFNDCHQQ